MFEMPSKAAPRSPISINLSILRKNLQEQMPEKRESFSVICNLLAKIDKLLSIPEATPAEVEELATSCEKYCEIFPVLFPHANMTPKMNILSCIMPKH